MEEEFIRNQERLKPQEEKIEEERSKVSIATYSVCYNLMKVVETGSYIPLLCWLYLSFM